MPIPIQKVPKRNISNNFALPGDVCFQHFLILIPSGRLPKRSSPSGNGSNRCIAAIGPSVSNPILRTTDRWHSVPGDQVLHNTARFQGAVEHRVSNLRLQIAFYFANMLCPVMPVYCILPGHCARVGV